MRKRSSGNRSERLQQVEDLFHPPELTEDERGVYARRVRGDDELLRREVKRTLPKAKERKRLLSYRPCNWQPLS